MVRSHLIPGTLAALFVLFLGCARRPALPEPPLPAQMAGLEDSIEDLVRTMHGRVVADPENGKSWADLAKTYEASHLLALALTCYDRAIELTPKDKLRYRRAMTYAAMGQIDEALATARAITEGEGRTPPHVLWRIGTWELMRGELGEAEASFQAATQVGPRYPGGFTGLARVQLQRDDNEAAISTLRKALVLVPTDEYVKQLLGAAYRQAGLFDAPEAQARDSTGIPAWADPWTQELKNFRAVTPKMQAKALLRSGRTQESIDVLSELRDGVDELGAVSIMAESYYRSGQLDKALESFRECLTVAPRNVGTFLNIARVQDAMGDYDDAIDTLAVAIELRPDFGQIHNYRGELMFVAGRYAEAIPVLEQALLLDARPLDTRLWIGRSHLALGILDAAAGVFEVTSKLEPPTGDAWIGLAEVRIHANELPEARVAIERARKLGHDNRAWYLNVLDQLAAAEKESQ